MPWITSSGLDLNWLDLLCSLKACFWGDFAKGESLGSGGSVGEKVVRVVRNPDISKLQQLGPSAKLNCILY